MYELSGTSPANKDVHVYAPTAAYDDLISNEARLIFQWVCCTVLGQFVAFFGTVTNTINIICFVNQGFNDSVNISLLGLSISDLCSLITLMWTYTCYTPALFVLDLPFDPLELQLLIGTWPHLTFTHVTGCITAFITVERCLCITMPIKVKTIFTPKRVAVIITSIFVVIMAAVAPIYCVTSYGMKFSPFWNKTILGVVFTEDRLNTEKLSYGINNIFIPFGTFIIVIVCTAILVVNLSVKRQWRKQSTTPGQSENLSNRDKKVARMMVMISTLFIVIFCPICVLTVVMIAVPELAMDGKYQNTLFSLGSVIFLLEAVNSATNIFIYYHMSSRYRNVFHQLILCRSKNI